MMGHIGSFMLCADSDNKEQPNNTQKHKITNPMTNWPKLKKTQKHTQKETKPKPTSPNSLVGTAHMSLHIIG